MRMPTTETPFGVIAISSQSRMIEGRGHGKASPGTGLSPVSRTHGLLPEEHY